MTTVTSIRTQTFPWSREGFGPQLDQHALAEPRPRLRFTRDLIGVTTSEGMQPLLPVPRNRRPLAGRNVAFCRCNGKSIAASTARSMPFSSGLVSRKQSLVATETNSDRSFVVFEEWGGNLS